MAVVVKTASRTHPDYSLTCRQTVTLYNVYKVGTTSYFHKTVFTDSAYLESKKNWQESKPGVTALNSSLLVIPQTASGNVYADPVTFDGLPDKTGVYTVRNGDKVIPGVGPDITTASGWSGFISATNPGLVVISSVDVKRNLAGDIVHVEAGGS